MTRFLVICLLLCACANEDAPPKELPPDDRLINTAIATWEAAGRPYAQKCADTRHHLLIVPAATADIPMLCTPDMPGTLLGCFIRPIDDTADPLLVITSDPAWHADTVVHETLHWLKWCNSAIGDPDTGHNDRELWDVILWDALANVTFP